MTQDETVTRIRLNEKSIKVNPENYLGMIHGCGDKKIKTIIHVSTDTSNFCKVLNKSSEQYFLLTASKKTYPSQPAVEKVIDVWVRKGLCKSK